MKPGPYGPFPYSPIIRRPRLEWPEGARLALWVVPNIEIFSLETRPGGLGPGKIPDIPTWAIRDYGNRVGVFRIMEVLDRYRHSRNRRAEQQYLHPPSGNHRRRREAPLGMDGAQSKQSHPPQRSAGRRGAEDHPRYARHHRSRERQASRRLAGRGTAGDLEHARSAGGRGLRVCRRLGPQRRSALHS